MTNPLSHYLLTPLLAALLLATGGQAVAQNEADIEDEASEVTLDSSSAEPTAEDELADEVIESDDDWLEDSKDYAARKANEMTQWVDNFFGNDERDLEQAESRLRLRTIYNWDERLDNEIKFRLGGKVSLPQISKRLDLVFRGEDMDDFSDNGVEDPSEDRVGLQLQVGPKEAKNIAST